MKRLIDLIPAPLRRQASFRRAALLLLAAGLALGTLADRVPANPPPRRDGHLLVQADLHVHSFLGDGAIPPWNLGREARRQGLHALAITNHNQIFAARFGRWWNRLFGQTVVLVGQEVTSPGAHLIGIGLRQAADWEGLPAQMIDSIHAAGGLAIAAHPDRYYHRSFGPEALGKLDGVERTHPLIFARPSGNSELATFAHMARRERDFIKRPLAEIGSSDFHTMSTLGRCRTLILSQDLSEASLLAAIRAGHTTAIAAGVTGVSPPGAPLPGTAPPPGPGGVLAWLGLLGLLFAPPGRKK